MAARVNLWKGDPCAAVGPRACKQESMATQVTQGKENPQVGRGGVLGGVVGGGGGGGFCPCMNAVGNILYVNIEGKRRRKAEERHEEGRRRVRICQPNGTMLYI